MMIIVTHSKENEIEQIERAGGEWKLGIVIVRSSLFFVVEQHGERRLRLVVGSKSDRLTFQVFIECAAAVIICEKR